MEKGYARIHVCLDAKEMVPALKGDFDRAITPISVDIKKLIFLKNSRAHFLAKLSYSCNQV